MSNHFFKWNCQKVSTKKFHLVKVFLRRFRDPVWVPRIRENYHRVPKISENRVPTDPYRVPNIFLKKKTDLVESSTKKFHLVTLFL